MATELKDYEFSGHKYARYPWHNWANGEVWEAKSGVDYFVPDNSFRSVLSNQAKRNGRTVRTHSPAEGTVVFQFSEVEVQVVEEPAEDE